jgi:hypothetical protein
MATLRMWEFVRRGQAAQQAVDELLAQPVTEVVRGKWIHLGCGGELVHLQGIAHPVCTTCAREVF